MGLFDTLGDLVSGAIPWGSADAEVPVTGGASAETTPATANIGKEEGEVKDPSGPTPDKRTSQDEDRDGANKVVIVDDAESDDEDDSKASAGEAEEDEGTEAEQEGEEETEEEEEEEMVDPKEKFEEECKRSKLCSPAKHEFDECEERVHKAQSSADKKQPTEDCVEEFFHLSHCATKCATPKLWSTLK